MIKILPQIHISGVDYSLFMVESEDEAMEKEEQRPKEIPAEAPPPISSGAGLLFL